MSKSLFFTAVLLLFVRIFEINSKFAMKTVKVECRANPGFLQNTTCKVRPINRYKALTDIDCDIVDELRNVTLDMEILYKNYANRFIPIGMRIETNMCDVYRRKNFPTLGVSVRKTLMQFSNLNHTCPYSGHVRIEGVYFSEELQGFILPTSSYKVVFKLFEGYPYVHIGTVEIFADIIEVIERPRKMKGQQILKSNN